MLNEDVNYIYLKFDNSSGLEIDVGWVGGYEQQIRYERDYYTGKVRTRGQQGV